MVSPLLFLQQLKLCIHAFLGRSIRRQLVLSFVLITFITMASFSVLAFIEQRNFLFESDTNRAAGLSYALASSSASWVLADDVAGLQEVLQGFNDTPDLKFAMVLSLRGEVIGATDASLVGLYANDKISRGLIKSQAEYKILISNTSLVDVAVPVMTGDRHVGWARVELSRNSSNNNLIQLAQTGLFFSLLAAAAAYLVAVWLARRLTRSLYHLMAVSKAVESGQHEVRATTVMKGEVGELALSFNKMLDTLDESERQLGRLNQLYAAWTECSAITVRQKDENILLNSICQVLAERVPFELVWIGVPAEDGWLRPVATSSQSSLYLQSARVSVDANKREGQGPLGTAVRTGSADVFNDFMYNPLSLPWRSTAEKFNYQSVGGFPLHRGGKCFGGIGVYSSEVNFFTPARISLMNGLAEDITFALDNLDREKQQRLAAIKLEQAATVFEHSKEGILVTDAFKRIISVNKSFTDITGYSAEEVIGHSPKLFSSGHHDQEFFHNIWKSINTNGSWQGEIWNRRKSGEVFPEALTIIRVQDDVGNVINYLAIFGDISERKLAEERIQKLAHYDVLTGLPNRILFNDRLEQAIIHALRSETKVALLFLDLDRFKQINDTLGHGAGDQLLQLAAQRLLTCVRDQDTVSRQGGDEFVAVLPGSDEEGAYTVAEKMLHSMIQSYKIEGHDLRISCSIGIAVFPDHAQDADTLIKYADVAMYQAKEGGRNRHLIFDPRMNATAYERLRLETALRVALDHKEMRLFYQPQIDLIDGRIVGCEALVRWQHPELGMVLPVSFIPLAEETGLIASIGDWVLEEALCQCRVWQDAGLQTLTMSVNLSALQFRERNLVEQVTRLLHKYHLPPSILNLELTEGVLMHGVERTLATLCDLTALGVTISIDDFGTGYSSLSYLKRFPIQQLKIDQSFVGDVTTDSSDATIVRTIILMAHSLNLTVIAEGVETEEQAIFLRQCGCERAQGYYFARPMPFEEFDKLLMKT